MTLGQLSRHLKTILVDIPGYTVAKSQAVKDMMLEDWLGLDKVGQVLSSDRELLPETVDGILRVVDKIRNGMPVQYALGRADFMGLKLKVTPAVLIPRPETAAIVDMVTDRYGDETDLDVLDLCTGSGCLALALSRALKFARVTAVDNSPEALDIARQNSSALHASIGFIDYDVLELSTADNCTGLAGQWDVIVSNPPYIPEKERSEVAEDVLAYEPRMALFVPDSDPLLFYRSIAMYAISHLKSGGGLYFEINPHYAAGIDDLLRSVGFDNVEIDNDFNGLKRYASAFKSR